MRSGSRSSDLEVANQGTRAETNALMNGPITDSDSKTVMIAAERGDTIKITNIISRVEDNNVPEELQVIQRSDTYYGPKLFTYSTIRTEERNFLLTAPGPDTQLQLWTEEVASSGKREGWIKAAEVMAVLPAEQPPYERCQGCGELVRSIEHERAALTGDCQRAENWS